jgi:hypothetical protein
MEKEAKINDLSQEFYQLKSRIKEVEKKNENILSKLHYFNED